MKERSLHPFRRRQDYFTVTNHTHRILMLDYVRRLNCLQAAAVTQEIQLPEYDKIRKDMTSFCSILMGQKQKDATGGRIHDALRTPVKFSDSFEEGHIVTSQAFDPQLEKGEKKKFQAHFLLFLTYYGVRRGHLQHTFTLLNNNTNSTTIIIIQLLLTF